MKPNERRCEKCGEPGPFATDNGRIPFAWCKRCVAGWRREFRRTPKGLAVVAWNGLLRRAGNGNGCHPEMTDNHLEITRSDFVEWFLAALAKFQADHPGERFHLRLVTTRGHFELGNLKLIPRQQVEA